MQARLHASLVCSCTAGGTRHHTTLSTTMPMLQPRGRRWFALPSEPGCGQPPACPQLPAIPQPLTSSTGWPQLLPAPQDPPHPHSLPQPSAWANPSPCLVRTQGRSPDAGLRWDFQEQLWAGPGSGSGSASTLVPQRSPGRVLFLHGFLGSARDWAPWLQP